MNWFSCHAWNLHVGVDQYSMQPHNDPMVNLSNCAVKVILWWFPQPPHPCKLGPQAPKLRPTSSQAPKPSETDEQGIQNSKPHLLQYGRGAQRNPHLLQWYRRFHSALLRAACPALEPLPLGTALGSSCRSARSAPRACCARCCRSAKTRTRRPASKKRPASSG